MAKTYYYAILNKNGNLVCLEGNLPIYWNKPVAIRERIERCGDSDRIVKIKITDIQNLLKTSKFNDKVYQEITNNAKNERQKKLVAALIKASTTIAKNGRTGKANYVVVPPENMKALAKKLNVTVDEAAILVDKYFQYELNNNISGEKPGYPSRANANLP